MRILHTSDWHLGHSYHDQPRAQEHEAFLNWLLQALEEHEVDALVIAGDVFDTANPPAEAQSAYYRFLAALSALPGRTRSGGRRSVVVVGGNHDSPTRLDAPRDVLRALDVHVVGGYDPARAEAGGSAEGALVPLAGAGGQVGLVVLAVPFLNDWRLGVRGLDGSAEEQLQSMHQAFSGVYSRLADRASKEWSGVPLMATGHLTCLAQPGRRVSEEDSIPLEINRVGTLGALGPEVFDPRLAYVALGHLHRSFAVDAPPGAGGRVWYSGTPVQVGSVEPADARQVLLVDVEPRGASVRPLPVPCLRRILPLAGSLEQVCAALRRLEVPAGELAPYLTVSVALDRPNPRARDLVLQAAQANTACQPRVVQVIASVARQGGAAEVPAFVAEDRPLQPEEAFLFAWRARHGSGAEPPEAVLARFRQLVSLVAHEEVAS